MSLKELLSYSTRLDMTVGIENLEDKLLSLFRTPEDARTIVKEIPEVKLVLDIEHATRVSGNLPLRFLRILHDRIIHLHISDTAGRRQHLALGNGTIRLEPILEALTKLYEGELITLEISEPNALVANKRLLEGWLCGERPDSKMP